MAQQTLAVLPLSHFHSLFSEEMLSRIDRTLAEAHLPFCDYIHPESTPGACDQFPCSQKAVVSTLSGDHAFCRKHVREVLCG
jgi:hypothetical protein